MMKLEIEYTPRHQLTDVFYTSLADIHVPVVRLTAVDQVIAEAVWAMEQLNPILRMSKRVQAVLASDTVKKWRERQKEEKKS
jgi:hypothetical protein